MSRSANRSEPGQGGLLRKHSRDGQRGQLGIEGDPNLPFDFGDKSLDELRARLEENELPVPDGFLGRSDAAEESDSVAEDASQAAETNGADEEESVTEFSKED